ncbi:MAG: 50S ribosomal protein L3 [Gemmataceae bacterium]|nr:50S ribosomal protein L3 [Gemmataceae bacterium]
MPIGLLGRKIGMTQVYTDTGKVQPVTVVQAGPCPVLQIRDKTRDGYDALQLGYKEKPRRKATRAERGHVSSDLESKRRKKMPAGTQLLPKPNCEPQTFIREFRLEAPAADITVGKVLTAFEVFKDVKEVDVIGLSKGRGFTGTMKKDNFHGLGASHGVKKAHRSLGGTGSLSSNRGSGRPKKGKKMPGRYGNERVTVRNLTVVSIDAENHLILVLGSIPGPNGGLVTIRPTNKVK